MSGRPRCSTTPPLLDGVDRLPVPQAEALSTTFGLRAGEAPSPFLLGLGVLNLLAEGAREQPLQCVVDDAHWLDDASAQVVAFVARRLRAESILMLIASREPIASMRGLSEMTVQGLGADAAQQLLNSVVRRPLDGGVRTAILAEARGNPLALLELPLASPDRLAGGFGLLEASALSGRIEESFRRRIAGTSPPARAKPYGITEHLHLHLWPLRSEILLDHFENASRLRRRPPSCPLAR